MHAGVSEAVARRLSRVSASLFGGDDAIFGGDITIYGCCAFVCGSEAAVCGVEIPFAEAMLM